MISLLVSGDHARETRLCGGAFGRQELHRGHSSFHMVLGQCLLQGHPFPKAKYPQADRANQKTVGAYLPLVLVLASSAVDQRELVALAVMTSLLPFAQAS